MARWSALQADQRTGSLFSLVLTAWQRNRDLIHNASNLIATTIVTTGLGFLYWAVGTRLYSQRAVGYESAAISAMGLLGSIGMFGLGTVLISELPKRKNKAGLVSAALIASCVGSAVLGVGFALIAPLVSSNLAGIDGSLLRVAGFTAGVVLTAFTLVADQASIGVLRSGIQLTRNAAFAAAKLLVLPLAAFTLTGSLVGPLGTGIMVSWVAGMGLSLIPIAIQLRRSGAPILPKPDWRLLRGLRRTALAHSWLSLAINMPVMLMPVLVTATVSASANAAYYIAWMLAFFLYLIPSSLSTVLFALAAADPAVIAGKLRFSLKLSFAIGIAGIAVLGLGSHLALSIFGPSYASTATLPLILLLIGYIPMVPRTHYIAVGRATGRISHTAVVLSICCGIEIVGALAGAKLDGLVGLSAGLLIARIVEGMITTPAVIRASFVRDRRGKVPSGNDVETVGSKEEQEAEIAALVALAAQAPNGIDEDPVSPHVDLDEGEDAIRGGSGPN